MSPPPPPQLFDRRLHRLRHERARARGAGVDFLKRRAAEEACWRLSAILRRFPLAVDLRAHGGEFAQAVRSSPAADQIDHLVEADLAPASFMGRRGAGTLAVVADEERSPFAPGRFDLAVSLLSLHWTNDLVGALVQARRLLKPDGLFIGSLFGGSTLIELRRSLLEAEAEVEGGAGPRVSPFADAKDGSALLQRAGFALPVSDVDRVQATYDHPLRLLADLRGMGETGVLRERPRRPLSRRVLERMSDIYRDRYALPDGRVPATFEIVSLTGWAPHPSQPKALKPGSASTRLATALGVEEHGRSGGR